MSVPGSQEVFMSSLMPISLKLRAWEGYLIVEIYIYIILAYRPALHAFCDSPLHLARVLRFELRARENFRKKKCVSIDSKCSETHRNAKMNFLSLWSITCFARSAKLGRRSANLSTPSHPQDPKECPWQVSCRSDQNCGQERDSYVLRALRVARSPSGETQLYLPQVTLRVPRSVHAKFHADQTKTVFRRGILKWYILTN